MQKFLHNSDLYRFKYLFLFMKLAMFMKQPLAKVVFAKSKIYKNKFYLFIFIKFYLPNFWIKFGYSVKRPTFLFILVKTEEIKNIELKKIIYFLINFGLFE